MALGFNSCTKEESTIQSKISESQIGKPQNISSLSDCLNETVVDSFIYYANEFNNHLNLNIDLVLDSIRNTQLAYSSNIQSLEAYYIWVANTFQMPKNIVTNFAKYSFLIQSELSKESIRNHPIATRYYELIQSGCLVSNLEFDSFYVEGRARDCGFWDLFLNTVGFAGSIASAVTVEVWTVGTGTVVAIGLVTTGISYGNAVRKCL